MRGGINAPANTSAESTFSAFLVFVTGISLDTCLKSALEVRYAIVLDMMVNSYSSHSRPIHQPFRLPSSFLTRQILEE